jgi:hypothetical protein
MVVIGFLARQAAGLTRAPICYRNGLSQDGLSDHVRQ